MWRWLAIRVGWLLATLLGVTFVTFAVLDAAPVDRAELTTQRASQEVAFPDREARARAVQQLRLRYGMLDPETLEPRPLLQRYGAWLGRVATLRLAGSGPEDEALWRRLREAAPVTALLGGAALALAFGIGIPVGTWLGRRAGRRDERAASTAMLAVAAVPDFLLATLLLLAFSSAWLQWFPASGLASRGAEEWSLPARAVDFVWHLTLPVFVMASGPVVLVSRFVRDAVARAAAAPFARNLAALGVAPREVRRRLARHGATPVATLVGTLLPMLVGGSIVVENMFALDGLGHLALMAVLDQDQGVVMALVLLTSFVTLVSLALSDLLHRIVDPRVRLAP